MTNTEKHTPGKWKVYRVSGSSGGMSNVADVHLHVVAPGETVDSVCAAVEAAPALLAQNKRLREALENILSQYEGVYDCTDNHGKLYQSQGARDAELAARAALNEKE